MESQANIDELIIRYLSQEVNQEDRARLGDWLEADPQHLLYFQQMSNTWYAANPPFSPESIDIEKAHTKFLRQTKANLSGFSLFLKYWQRAAAILLLPLLVFFSYLFIDNKSQPIPESFQEVTTPYGTQSKLNLPDGSVVWLNGGSTLRYPLFFEKGKRNVQLMGEAYFEVQSDNENPFVVEVGDLWVRATGTAFNIEAFGKDSVISVTMTEGVVDIRIGNKNPFVLKPGERMRYDQRLAKVEILKTDPYKWYAWKDGLLVFRDDPLAYVFKKVGQTFNVDIAVKDTGIARHLYRATFENESLDEILKLLQLSAPITYRRLEREKTSENKYKQQEIEVYGSQKKK